MNLLLVLKCASILDDDSCSVAYQVLKKRPCHSAAYCIDKVFSHECYCQEGYTGDGLDYCDGT